MRLYVGLGASGLVVSALAARLVSDPFGRVGIFVFLPGAIGLLLLWLATRLGRWTRQMRGALQMPGKPVEVAVARSVGMYGKSVMSVEVRFPDGGVVVFRDPPWSQPSTFFVDAIPGLFWGERERGSAVLVATGVGATATLLNTVYR
ncbi:MAG: hypothetical protein JWM93_1582 [Frankiales bacterium]|nr:hypothetical protein [Frankiales bacterium]